MKKLTFLAAMAIAVATMVSCNGNNPKASLKNDIDTLSYAIGVAQTNGLNDYLTYNKGVDTTYMAEFIQGFIDGANAADDKGKAAYFAGVEVGRQLGGDAVKSINMQLFGNDSTQSISAHNLMAGFINTLMKKNQKMTVEEADSIAQTMFERIHNNTMEKKFAENKQASEQYLADNTKNDSVKVVNVVAKRPDNGQEIASFIQYKVLKEGNGAIATDTNTVVVNYEGRLIDGTVFDSSYQRNQPYTVDMKRGGVILGWLEVLKRMPAGSVWEVAIPQELAYGNQDRGTIKPFSTLIFKIEVLEVK